MYTLRFSSVAEMLQTRLFKVGIFIGLLSGIIYWKKSLKYDLTKSIYGTLSQIELIEAYKVNSELRVFDRVFSILKHPQIHDVKITVIVKSAPGNIYKRRRTRLMFEPFKNHLNLVFLLGTFKNQSLLGELNFESTKYKDILQVSLEDGYKNLVYKVLASMQWIYENQLPNLQWIIMMDDDIHLEVSQLLKASETWKPENTFICSSVFRNFPTTRTSKHSVNNKWAVSEQEWPMDKYPDYCIGWMYAFQPSLALQLALASRSTPKMFLEDVYITGILRERLGVKIQPIFQHWTNYFQCPVLNLVQIYLLPSIVHPIYLLEAWPWKQMKYFYCQFLESFGTFSYCENAKM